MLGVLKTAVLCVDKWQWTVVVCYIKLTLRHFLNNATLLGSVRWLGCGLGDRSLSFEAQKRKGIFVFLRVSSLVFKKVKSFAVDMVHWGREGRPGRDTLEN